MPEEPTARLYSSLQLELKTTDEPVRKSFSSGFCHKNFAELLFCQSRMWH